MKQLAATLGAFSLLVGSSLAADLPRRAAPPVFTAVPVFTWTGFYAGLESAYTFTDRQRITTRGADPAKVAALNAGIRPATTFTETDGIAKVGGGLGYNYQFTPGSGFVAGVAANWDWTDIHKNRFVLGVPQGVAPATPTAFRQGLDWIGTVTGKLGYAFDRFLVYGAGGFAYGDVQYSANFYAYNPALTPAYIGRFRGTETGFAYGGGVEYAIPADSFLNYFTIGKYLGIKSEAVTIKVEYLHYDLGSRTLVLPAIAGVGTNFYASRFRTEGNLIRAGFNYKFGGL